MKKFIVALLALAMVTTLTLSIGCTGGEKKGTEKKEEKKTEEKKDAK